MKKTALLRHLLAVSIILFTALPAAATKNQSETLPPSIDDWFVVPGDWWTTQITDIGSYTTCGLANGCWACLQNQYGKRVCAYGVSQGHCNCQDVQRQGAAPGITYCRMAGGQCATRTTP